MTVQSKNVCEIPTGHSQMIRIAPDLSLPLESVTRRMAILGMSGSGKSNAAVVLAEAFFDAGLPWVVIDPKGDWWGIRSNKSGKGAGLPIPIFGGLHGDIQIEPTVVAGKELAEAIVDQRLTCVIDISEFTDRQAMWAFLTALGETFLHRNRQALHLFLEEADEYCLTPDTEVLTQYGWRRISELGIGELVISYEIESGTCKYEPVQRLISKQFKGDLVHLKTSSLDCAMTPDHRAIIRRFQHNPCRYRLYPPTFCEASELPAQFLVPSSPGLEGPGVLVSHELLRVIIYLAFLASTGYAWVIGVNGQDATWLRPYWNSICSASGPPLSCMISWSRGPSESSIVPQTAAPPRAIGASACKSALAASWLSGFDVARIRKPLVRVGGPERRSSFHFQPASFTAAATECRNRATSLTSGHMLIEIRCPANFESCCTSDFRCSSVITRQAISFSILARARLASAANCFAFAARLFAWDISLLAFNSARFEPYAMKRPIATSANTPTTTNAPPIASWLGHVRLTIALNSSRPDSIHTPRTTNNPASVMKRSSQPNLIRFGLLLGPFMRRRRGAGNGRSVPIWADVLMATAFLGLAWFLLSR